MNILIKLINDVKALCNTIITAVNAIKAKTDTITADLFTATHASRIDATISSRQANAGLTTTHAGRIDASISSRASQASVDAIKAKTDVLSGGMKSRVYYETANCNTSSANDNEVYTTKKTVSGKGKLHFLMFDGSRTCLAKIIIDGITVLWGTIDGGTTDGYSPFGIVMSNYLQTVYTGTQWGIRIFAPYFGDGGLGQYFPKGFGSSNDMFHINMDGTKYSNGGIILLEEPLEFNTSLVIQVANITGQNGNKSNNAFLKYELLT